MDPFVHQVAERGEDQALAGEAGLAGERLAFDRQRDVAFAAGAVAGVADVVRSEPTDLLL